MPGAQMSCYLGAAENTGDLRRQKNAMQSETKPRWTNMVAFSEAPKRRGCVPLKRAFKNN